MPFQVMHRDEPFLERPGQRLGVSQPDQERADQSGAEGRGDRVYLVQTHARLGKRFLQHLVDDRQVLTARRLGHHAAVARGKRGLRGDDVGEYPISSRYTDAGIIAGGVDAQNEGRLVHLSKVAW